MPKTAPVLFLTTLILALLTLALACDNESADTGADDSAIISNHMVAEAMLTARYIDAALKAGMTADEINAALSGIADQSAISEFWISDSDGRVEFTNVSGIEFAFPTDPNAGTQAAPFADLLNGSETVVVQDFQPREADSAVFKYVGVAGVDKPRIVQVGIKGEE